MNAALVCHWGARKAYDFFLTTFNHRGYDGNNKKLNIYVNYDAPNKSDNAYWSPINSGIKIGSGSTKDTHYGVVDIVAHEFAHAVTDSMAKLNYEGESGAINEGISDIWAACVENNLGATSYEVWNHENHRGTPSRVFYDPNSSNPQQPDTYQGQHWKDTIFPEDYGGVHTNSGILNYWFYLLTIGGSGINDNQEPYNVEGLGFFASQRILYQTVKCYLEPNSNFSQMKGSTLYTTALLYGIRSNAYKQVMNAWHAIGLSEPYMDEYSIIGTSEVCNNGVYSINNLHPAFSITWSIDSFTNTINQHLPKLNIVSGQNTGTITIERAHTGMVSPTGTFYYYNGDVTLTATISYGNETYTIQKSLFVNTPLPDIQYTITQGSTSLNKNYKFYVNNVASNYLNWRIEANGNVYTTSAQNYIEANFPTLRTYDVIVSVTDNGGCSTSNYKTLTLQGTTITWPVLSHENPVNTNSTFYLSKKIEEPNDDVIYNIEIWNNYGLIYSEKYDDATEFMISTNGLIPGVYFMKIYRNGEFLSTQKLIIK